MLELFQRKCHCRNDVLIEQRPFERLIKRGFPDPKQLPIWDINQHQFVVPSSDQFDLPRHVGIRSLHELHFSQNVSHVFCMNSVFATFLKVFNRRNFDGRLSENMIHMVVV